MQSMFAIIGADRCSDLAALLMELSESLPDFNEAVHGMAFWLEKEYVFRRMPDPGRRRLAMTAIAPPPICMAHTRGSMPTEHLIPFGVQPLPCRGGALMHSGVVTVPANWPEEQADFRILVRWIESSSFHLATSRLDNPHATIFAREDHTVLAAAEGLPLFVRELEPGVTVLHDFADSIGGEDLRGRGVVPSLP